MRNTSVHPADLAPLGAIIALVENDAARALANLFAGHAVTEALDRQYGRNGWFVFWDEDLSGKPIRGTIQLAFGRETLVIG